MRSAIVNCAPLGFSMRYKMCENNSVEYSAELVNEHGEESLHCSDTGCSLITV